MEDFCEKNRVFYLAENFMEHFLEGSDKKIIHVLSKICHQWSKWLGPAYIDDWSKLNDEDLKKHMVKFKGIGPWTAEMVMMFSLMRPDVFSVKDLGLVKGVQKLVPEAKTKESVEKVAERWKPYRTAASWYLWRMQDPVPVEY